jgi:uncharacterized protein
VTRLALRQRARGFWQKLSRLDARPDQIAAGFSIGIVASFVPLNPSPVILATVVAWLLKKNIVAAVAGAAAAILYIPLLPLIWLAEYELGAMMLPIEHRLTLDHLRLWEVLQNGWDVYAAMCVGSIIIATPVALLTYLVVNRFAEKWARQRKQPQSSD